MATDPTTTEAVRDHYQLLVDAQIDRFKQPFVPDYSPLKSGVLYLAKDHPDDVPLWSLPFKDKPVQPAAENVCTLEITDEKTLIVLGVPRQYDAIIVEREIVLDHRDDEALVERVYFRFKPELGSVLTLMYVTTVTKYYGYGNEFKGKLKVDTQVPERIGISMSGQMEGTEVRPLLKESQPIVTT